MDADPEETAPVRGEATEASRTPENAQATPEEVEELRAAVNRDHERVDVLLPSHDQLDRKDKEQDIKLRRRYATWVLFALAVQLAVVNAVFVTYAWVGEDWRLSSTVISIYFGSTLAEIIGIVAIVMNYLFPPRGRPGS